MREYLEELCDGIDAAVFSGDVLYSDDERKELAEYISRWSNAIGEHEAIAAAEQAQQAEPVARSTGNFHGDVNGNVFCEVATAGKVIPAGTPLYAQPPAGGAPQATAEDSSVVQDAVAVPDGYALVPIEPTAQMVEAGFGRDDDNCKFWLHPAQAYRAMLASAAERPK